MRDLIGTDALNLDDDMLQTITRILFGALSAAGETVVGSTDPGAASARVEAAMGLLISGMRALTGQREVSGS